MSRKIITALMITLMSVFMVIAPGRVVFGCDETQPPGSGCEEPIAGGDVDPIFFVPSP